MTEAEVMAQTTTFADMLLNTAQYWTSVSFGVLVAAHLTKGQVSGTFIAIALFFYIGFTWTMSTFLMFDIEMIKAGVSTLTQLAQDGHTLSPMGETAVKNGPAATSSANTIIARRIVMLGIFVLTCAYPIYCYYKTKSVVD